MYGLGYLDPDMRAGIRYQDEEGNWQQTEPDWPVRRSLLYHYSVRSNSSERAYSLFVLVSAQRHVEQCLLRFFQQSGQGVGGEDPFNAHVVIHHHCLGNWPAQVDRISKKLRDRVR